MVKSISDYLKDKKSSTVTYDFSVLDFDSLTKEINYNQRKMDNRIYFNTKRLVRKKNNDKNK